MIRKILSMIALGLVSSTALAGTSTETLYIEGCDASPHVVPGMNDRIFLSPAYLPPMFNEIDPSGKLAGSTTIQTQMTGACEGKVARVISASLSASNAQSSCMRTVYFDNTMGGYVNVFVECERGQTVPSVMMIDLYVEAAPM